MKRRIGERNSLNFLSLDREKENQVERGKDLERFHSSTHFLGGSNREG